MTEVFKTYIHTDKNEDMADFLLPLSEKILNESKENKNYRNGKSSYYTPDIIPKYISQLKPFYDYIRKNITQYLIIHNYIIKDLSINIDDLWFSEMYKAGRHEAHCHSPGSQISGNFYVKTDEHSGLLRFYRHEFHNNIFYKLKVTNYNTYNNETYTFTPKKGLLCIWRSDLQHSVDYNESDSRIAVSFNATVDYV